MKKFLKNVFYEQKETLFFIGKNGKVVKNNCKNVNCMQTYVKNSMKFIKNYKTYGNVKSI